MLIRKIHKKLGLDMISQLHGHFVSPHVWEKSYTFLHSPSFQPFLKFPYSCGSLKFPSNNTKLSVSKSATCPPIHLSVDRNTRVAKTEAQAALFDYLHCTRGFSFLDAEHMSKNSPQFLEGLISKVETEEDILKALLKFFRYNPVNEFEPFFESVGLKPMEFAPLLPRGLIYLNDDIVLLDNYHTLCDFGIPRSIIGRMCKDANEIFAYQPGVLNMKLRAYEKLGFARSMIIKLVSCSPLLLVGDVSRSFIQVLKKLQQMGFEKEWIGGYLSTKKMYNWDRIFYTMRFLQEVGYNDDQLAVLFKTDTALLFDGSGKNVYILVGALLKLGISMSEVYGMFLNNPQILSRKFSKCFWKALYLLFELGMKPDYVVKVLRNNMKYFDSHVMNGPKTVLKNFKGDKHSLCETIENDPSTFFSLAFKSDGYNTDHAEARKPNCVFEKTEFLTGIGFVQNSDEMVKALKKFRGRGDQLQERFDCLVRSGLDFNIVSSMVKRAPNVLNQSKDILEKKVECLKKYLGYSVDSIAGFPAYLCYDMNRISVRFSMYAWLRDKGVAKPMISVSTLLASSDARFVNYFVKVHPEGPKMWETLKKSFISK